MSKCENCIHHDCCSYHVEAFGGFTGRGCKLFKDKANYTEVIRCIDCKYYSISRLECRRPLCNGIMGMNDSCSHGERK